MIWVLHGTNTISRNKTIPYKQERVSVTEGRSDDREVISSLAEHLVATVHTTVYDDMGRASSVEVPNYPVQEKAQEKLIRVMELVKPEVGPVAVNINIGMSASEVKMLMEMAADVKSQLDSLRGSGKQTGEVIDV